MAADEMETETGSKDHLIQDLERPEAASGTTIDMVAAAAEEEISPLLPEGQGRPDMTIFSISYPSNRRTSVEQISREAEGEATTFHQFILWLWSRSKYSGFLCIACSSVIYCGMELFANFSSGYAISILRDAFNLDAKCYKFRQQSTGKSTFGPRNIRNLLLSRSLAGYLSLVSFIYSVQNLPLAYAMILNSSTPLMASIAARMILKEKLTFIDIGGLMCGFVGLLFIFVPKILVQGGLAENGNAISIQGHRNIQSVLIGVLSTTSCGISYCFIKSAAKVSDEPVFTVLAFGILASLLSAICTFSFQEFVMPDLLTSALMILLGVLAFFAEVFLARGLQLEKISKAMTFLYFKALLSQILAVSLSQVSLSFSRLVGCMLILASVSCTILRNS